MTQDSERTNGPAAPRTPGIALLSFTQTRHATFPRRIASYSKGLSRLAFTGSSSRREGTKGPVEHWFTLLPPQA